MADNKFTYKEHEDDAETVAADDYYKTVNASQPGDFVFSGGDFAQSDNVTNLFNKANQVQIPGKFQFSLGDQAVSDAMNQILNREKFSYDVTGDALYQQYKDQYVNQGKLAMMDTIGQAQAATGGYGNSYAQGVGQQAYQGYLQQLNDRVPELYQLALDKYNQEGQELYNRYGLLSDRENTEYGRYRDSKSDAIAERDYYTNLANNERAWEYGLYSDRWDREHTLHRDSVSDWQYANTSAYNDYWNKRNFGYGKYTDDKGFAYTEYRDGKEDEQTAKDNALREAETAASLGDYSKLKDLGFNTENAGKIETKYEVLSDSQMDGLYELAEMGTQKDTYTDDDPNYERILDLLSTYKAYYNIDPELIGDLTNKLIPNAYLEYVKKREESTAFPKPVDTTVESIMYTSGGGGGGNSRLERAIKIY